MEWPQPAQSTCNGVWLFDVPLWDITDDVEDADDDDDADEEEIVDDGVFAADPCSNPFVAVWLNSCFTAILLEFIIWWWCWWWWWSDVSEDCWVILFDIVDDWPLTVMLFSLTFVGLRLRFEWTVGDEDDDNDDDVEEDVEEDEIDWVTGRIILFEIQSLLFSFDDYHFDSIFNPSLISFSSPSILIQFGFQMLGT